MTELRYTWEFRSLPLPPAAWGDREVGAVLSEPEGSGWQPLGVNADGTRLLWGRRRSDNLPERVEILEPR